MKIIQLIGKIKDEPNADKYFADAKKWLLERASKDTKVETPQEIIRNYEQSNMSGFKTAEKTCLALCIQNIIDTFLSGINIEIYALWNIVENSKGALLEHKIADALGIPVTLILKEEIYGVDE